MAGRFTRRDALGAAAVFATARAAKAAPAPAIGTLDGDEAYWARVAALYDVTREIIHLENGNWGMMARPVLAAYERHQETVNRRNSYYARREYGADAVRVKQRIASALGVAPEEIALTRGATEALQNLIGGYRRLGPGDAVLYADLDYDSMQTAMEWLRVRRGVDAVKLALPEPASHQNVIDAYAAALEAHPNIRLLLLTHLSHRTGLIVPVRELCELARARGADVIVDAAHSWGQLDFRVPDLGADFVGLNLHKWIGAPIGVGALYIRKDRIDDVEPYMGEPEGRPNDIDARVHTGTANYAAFLAVPDALDLHEAITSARKEARLRHLRDLWAERLRGHKRIEILTPPDPRMYGGITAFRLDGRSDIDANIAVARELLERFNIFTVHRTGLASGACVRVTPSLFNSEQDIVALTDALPRLTAG